MTTPILLTGGTGTLGRLVAPRLQAAGCHVRVLSRGTHDSTDGLEYVTGDLLKDEGIETAVHGTDVIVHLAGAAKGDGDATSNLMRAAAQARVRHLVYISVTGADRLPLGYFRSKLQAERAVAASGVPWTTLRAAQFHDLVLTVMEKMTKSPVIPVPRGARLQPVDADDVAARLVDLTLGPSMGMVPDLVGPHTYQMADLIHAYLRSSGKHRALMPVRMPGKAGRAYRAGENLAADGALVGTRTWEEFLGDRLGGSRRRSGNQQ